MAKGIPLPSPTLERPPGQTATPNPTTLAIKASELSTIECTDLDTM
jgi:hypothetical protein